MFELVKYLHVLTMIATVTFAVVPTFVLLAVARRGDVAAVRSVAPLVRSVRGAAPVLFVAGAVFGLVTAIVAGINPMRPWLIGSYVALTVAILTGAVLADPWARRVGDAAAESPIERPSGDFRAAIADTRAAVAAVMLIGAVGVLIFLAAIKPGG
jgi:hypothetical protein